MRRVLLLPVSLLLTAFAATLGAAEPAAVPHEHLDRGLIARPITGGKAYLGWRLLRSDPADVAFDVYRRVGPADPVKLNSQPIHQTTDFVDAQPPKDAECLYFVCPAKAGPPNFRTGDDGTASFAPSTSDPPHQYVSIKLDGDTTFQKIGIADLDGDGRYDYVIKQPNANIDPYVHYWKRSPGTYKLEAYRHDGKRLWQYDLGWSIEQGIWYSPYVVYDFDGDGKAEVAVKTGQDDPRDADGRVQSGPEFLTILDGQTGKPITQVDWPSRDDFTGKSGYNLASRNQLGIAYLDGRTPSLIVERGTYTIIKAVAYQLRDGRLHQQWQWDNIKLPSSYRGQGAHWMHAADVDQDGRQEVILGSVVLDDNGTALWTTGLGHPDHSYVGDLDPNRPGLEIYYGIETRRPKNCMCMVDARTGEILWGYDKPSIHIHSSGLVADLDPKHPGAECYSGERDAKDKRWVRDCQGNVLSHEDLGGLAPRAAYWDADLQRELVVDHRISKYHGAELPTKPEGALITVADILGDWREELITSVPGELRIYTTTIPATDRRVTLMQDPIYRIDVAHAAMGYTQVPTPGYDLATQAGKK